MPHPKRVGLVPLEPRISPTVAPAGVEFRVNTSTTNSQSAPSVASDANGNFVVVWESLQNNADYDIYFRKFDKSGNPLVAQTLVNVTLTNAQRSPSVAMDSDGDFIVTWEGYAQTGGDSYDVYARKYNSSANPVTGEFRVNTYTTEQQFRPSVAVDADGDFAVAWQSYQDGSMDGIYFQRYDKTAAVAGGETLVNSSNTTNFQVTPSIGMDADGDFAIAWASYFQDTSGYGVYARRYNANGTPVAVEFKVSQTNTGHQQEPAVALDQDGDFAVAWESYAQDGDGFGIYARKYNVAAGTSTNEFLVNTATTGDQRTPAVALDVAGNLVITWSSFSALESTYGIYGQRYKVSLATDGGELHVNTHTTGHQNVPAVANDAAGNFVAVWQSNDQDGSSTGVYSQRYGVLAPPPKITSLTIDDGTDQRSRVASITIVFDSTVTFPNPASSAFSLTGPGGGIGLSITSPATNTYKLTFSSGSVTAGSLDDGDYLFVASASKITNSDGTKLDGNGDGNAGDDRTMIFFRRYGDSNGDRLVNLTDFGLFRTSFGKTTMDPGFPLFFDYDNLGSIDLVDFGQFRIRFGIEF